MSSLYFTEFILVSLKKLKRHVNVYFTFQITILKSGVANDEVFKKYEVDSERDAHIGRHMNLFASGFYEPPLALSLPVAIERIKLETSTELEVLKRGQSQCRFKITWSQNVFVFEHRVSNYFCLKTKCL